MLLDLKCKLFILSHFYFCLWFEIKVQFYSSACVYTVSPILFIEELVLFQCILSTPLLKIIGNKYQGLLSFVSCYIDQNI